MSPYGDELGWYRVFFAPIVMIGAFFVTLQKSECHSEPVRRLAWESPGSLEIGEIATSAFGLLAMTKILVGRDDSARYL